MVDDPYVLGRPPRRDHQPLRARVKRYAKIVIVLGTILLLMGQGEAIYAAPILVPALWWAARRSGAWARAGITFLAALVMLEVGWFVAYSAGGEQQPYITLGPALGFVATIVFVVAAPHPAREPGDGRGGGGWRDFDLTALIAFLLAAFMSSVTIGLMFVHAEPFLLFWAGLSTGACAAVWTGLWAWRRGRYAIAAVSFLLSLAWPFGLAFVLTGPVSIALTIVSTVRAIRSRSTRAAGDRAADPRR